MWMTCSAASAFGQLSSSIHEVHIGQSKQSALDSIQTHPGAMYCEACVQHFDTTHEVRKPMDFLAYTGYVFEGRSGNFWLYLSSGSVIFTVWAMDCDSAMADRSYADLCADLQLKYGSPVRDQNFTTPIDCVMKSYRSGTEGICVSLLHHGRISIGRFTDPSMIKDGQRLSEAFAQAY
jgi:hypothetical protein